MASKPLYVLKAPELGKLAKRVKENIYLLDVITNTFVDLAGIQTPAYGGRNKLWFQS